ncbi:unnamed protein product [Pylaiella littoralis]
MEWPRGPLNMLHEAAGEGDVHCTIAIVSMGLIDINQREPKGCTPLMFAVGMGHAPVVKVLLNRGANVSIEADDGFTALHLSAQNGHLAVAKMLIEAGAELEATDTMGSTPLYSASLRGHWRVMRALIEAGANVDTCRPDGERPLFITAFEGHTQGTRELLHAKADPSLTKTMKRPDIVALDMAAQNGHLGVVRELIQHVGIEGCGGPSEGEIALRAAAHNGHTDIVKFLADSRVVGTCLTLLAAALHGQERSMRCLLQQSEGPDNVNSCNPYDGQTPLMASITSYSPRVARLLIDAGADTASAVRHLDESGEVVFNDTPLAYTVDSLSRRTDELNNGTDTSENDAFLRKHYAITGKYDVGEKLRRLESIHRLLLQVDAVHAISWLWPGDVPAIAHASEGPRTTKAAPTQLTQLTVMLRVTRRGFRRRDVPLAAFCRYSRKQ